MLLLDWLEPPAHHPRLWTLLQGRPPHHPLLWALLQGRPPYHPLLRALLQQRPLQLLQGRPPHVQWRGLPRCLQQLILWAALRHPSSRTPHP